MCGSPTETAEGSSQPTGVGTDDTVWLPTKAVESFLESTAHHERKCPGIRKLE